MSVDLICRDVVELLNDYLEGALSPDERAHVQAHLDACHGCTAALEQLRMAIAATGRLQMDRLPEVQREILRAAFRHHLGATG